MQNKPAQTFVLVAMVVAILIYMHFLPQISVAGNELRPVNLLSDVIPKQEKDAQEDEAPMVPPAASLAAGKQENQNARPMKNTPQPAGTFLIEDYSGGAQGGMERFYHALRNSRSLNRPVRIAYFGDSFVEGDILTCDLREMLQDRFGGMGAGWVDCGHTSNSNRGTAKVTSNGMVSYAVMNRSTFNKNLQGISERYFVPSRSAWVNISGTSFRKHIAQGERSEIYFKTRSPLTLTASLNGGKEETFRMEGSGKVQSAMVKGNIKKVKWAVNDAKEGIYFYGATIEGDHGITLDNFSMRGSSGITLKGIPDNTLADFAEIRPYDLIILHFGLNVASSKNTKAYYEHYKKQMVNVVNKMKRSFPHAAFLVISISDKDERTQSGINTMRGLETLVAYQNMVAAETHTAFFNLYKAMGGKNSMKAMAESQPPKANRDYTHINYRGGKFLAKKIYDAIMAGY